MADINAGKVRSFRHGGRILFSTDVVLNIPRGGGSMRFTHGVRERLTDAMYDQGELATVPPEGDDQPGEVSFDVRYTGDAGTTGSVVQRLTKDSADGYAVNEDCVVEVFAKPGGTTGEKFTFPSAWLAEPISHEVGSGTEGDILRCRLNYLARKPTIDALPGI